MHVSLDSALGRQRRLNSVGESVLQIAPNAKAAYSLRSLTGGDPKVVRVRRDTGGAAGDNDEQDFTVSGISSGALVDFVGSGNDGFVDTWYDQSGNGNDAEQATAGNQPKIVNSGSLVVDSGIAGLDFDGSTSSRFLVASSVPGLESPFSIFSTSVRDATGYTGSFTFGDGTTLSTFLTNKSDGDENAYLFRFVSDYIVYNTGGGVRRVFAGTNANSGSLGSDEELWTTISTLNSSGGTANFFADGTLVSSADVNIGTKTVNSKVLNIGGSASSNHWNGTINEVIFYATDQTLNRVALEANIMTNYGIS